MEGGIIVNNLFDKKGHLTQLALMSLKAGSLTKNELILVTSHIADCLSCAGHFADSFADSELKQVPRCFTEKLENRIFTPFAENSKKLRAYSLRVGLAVCASLTIVFISSLVSYANFTNYAAKVKPPELSIVYSINSELKDFSQKILNMEVFSDETKKR